MMQENKEHGETYPISPLKSAPHLKAHSLISEYKADFHLKFFVGAGVAQKSEHVKWSRLLFLRYQFH